ncbi:MAG: S9 family peptidase [Chlamydiota bacterium]
MILSKFKDVDYFKPYFSASFFFRATLLFLSSCANSKEPSLKKQEQKYGMWSSSITAETTCTATKFYGNLFFDNNTLYWTEVRPAEEGRSVIVSEKGDITPPGFSVRTRVHEYGGKSYTVHNGTVYFVNFSDQCIYMQKEHIVKPLTKPGIRFADLITSEKGIIAIGELHRGERYTEVDNFLSYIDKETGSHTILSSGKDFYSSPTLSPDGKKLAWLSWNFPNMPWDGTELWIADFSEGMLHHPRRVAGGDKESIFQPSFSPSNDLYFVSDKSGFWNLYRLQSFGYEEMCPIDAEFGLPQWVFGMYTYSFTNEGILCTYFQNGESVLALIDVDTKQLKKISLDGNYFAQIRSQGNVGAYLKGSWTKPTALFKLHLNEMEEIPISQEHSWVIDPDDLSEAKPISFPSKNGRTAYGFYYAPKNKNFTTIPGELPPLIIETHGGPTAHVTGLFSLCKQYWTNRGYAVLDVNYGGSSGYGRAYRDLLNNNWGIVDVEDCQAGAQYLARQGLADPKKTAITGGSAGGYTTLAALAFTDTFSVGGSYFGVSDPARLTKTTHKFEAHYFDLIIAPYPEGKEIYDARSPLQHADKINHPVIFFQGLDDKIVTPDQSEIMYLALKKRNIPTKIFNYEGEQHGFRKIENLINSLEEEHAFYQEVFDADSK